MTVSIYEELISLEKATSQQVKDKLVQLNIANIFAYALEQYWEIFKPLVIFTAHTYSYESKLIKIGMDWEDNKLDIAQKSEIPESKYEAIVRLQDKELANCFQKYLSLYMHNMDFVHLIRLKETYQAAIIRSQKEQEVKEQIKLMHDLEELMDSIEAYEIKVKQHYRILNNPMKDFEHAVADNSSNPLKIENVIKA